MKKLGIYLTLFIGLLTSISAEAEYLWWVVDEPSVTYTDKDGSHTTGTENLWLNTESGRMYISDARVRVQNSSAGVDEYLTIMFPDEGLEADSVSVEPLPAHCGDVWAIWIPKSAQYEGYSFAIELGNYANWEDPNSWTALATSGFKTYADIKDYIAEIETEVPISEYWNPNQFTAVGGAIPEPTSGMLVLIGAGLLALRRRRA